MAIITTIEQLKDTVKVNKAVFDNWIIYLNDARDRFLIPYLGEKLVIELETVNETSTSEADKPLLAILSNVRRVLGPFAVMLGTHEMSINTGDTGHTVAKTDKLAPASDSKINKSWESLADRAWQNLEYLLDYIEKDITKYPLWKESGYYKRRQTKYFFSASVFQDSGLVDIDYSRLTFEKLRQLIIRIEKSEVIPLLTPDIANDILESGGTSTELKKKVILLEYVRAFIGARVALLHTSQTTRVQRSKNNSLEYNPVIRPLYEDMAMNGNYYTEQAAYWRNMIISMLPDFGIDISGSALKWNNEDNKLMCDIG